MAHFFLIQLCRVQPPMGGGLCHIWVACHIHCLSSCMLINGYLPSNSGYHGPVLRSLVIEGPYYKKGENPLTITLQILIR